MKLDCTQPGKISRRTIQILLILIVLTGFLFGLPFYLGMIDKANQDGSSQDTNQVQKKPRFDSVYIAILKQAQAHYLMKNYEAALTEYEMALKFKPNEAGLKKQIDKVKVLIDQQKKTDQDFQKAITSADNYFKAKDWLNAKSAYQYALNIKPDDQNAKDKLKQVMDMIRSQKAQNILYDVAVANAEKLFQAKEYEKAKVEFENANKILPDDRYARDRINAIIKIMADNQSKEEMYAKAVTEGDRMYKAKSYTGALLEYQSASSYKPEEKYPKDKIAELTTLINSMKAKDEAYNKSIAKADELFKALTYADSKKEYQNALSLKPDEIYPKNMIRQIDEILAGNLKRDAEYDRLVNAGDSLYIEKKYISAKANYQQALKIEPAESYPKEMIIKVEGMIVSQQANEKAIDEAYNAALASADKQFSEKSYDLAKAEYQNAQNIKPAESYPKVQIAKIDGILAELQQKKMLEDQYAAIIAGADKFLTDKNYENAKKEYEKGLQLKPGELYPKDKIAEINKILADLALLKGKQDQYGRFIANADKMLADKMYEQSRMQYQQALTIKPEEQYPKDKIAEIEKVLIDILAKKEFEDRYRNTLINADKLLTAKQYEQAKVEYQNALTLKPEDEYPKKRIEEINNYFQGLTEATDRDNRYKVSIDKADKLFLEKEFDQSKTEYLNARQIKTDELYPKNRIAEIDQVLADLLKQKNLEDQYAALIQEGDRLLSVKSYPESRTQYESALKLKPEQKYPQDKIAEIDAVLAELAKQKSLDDNYNTIILKADKLFTGNSFESAKFEYNNALKLKPDEKYPQDKINEIDKLLADAAQLKATDDQYNASIAKADKYFTDKFYIQAKAEFGTALKIKPGESYPSEKIAAIDKILADIAALNAKEEEYKSLIDKGDNLLLGKQYEEAKSSFLTASNLKPEEVYPKNKISEITATLDAISKQKALDEQYSGLISQADKLFGEKSYTLAQEQYQSALNLKPQEKYPKDQLTLIDKALSDLAALKAIDDRYNASIAKADQLLNDKSYDQAKTEYLNAGKIKPAEKYPKDKVAEIDKTVSEIAKQKSIDEQYKTSIAKADKFFADQLYDQAKVEFINAGSIKPSEQYPKDRIAEIESVLADIKAKIEAYKISITKADQLLAQKTYEDARTEYQNASAIKPNEQYPKNKINEINNLLVELKGKKQTFDDLVQKGDNQFAQQEYYTAKDLFQQASEIFPEEGYPKQRLTRLNSIIDSIYRTNKGKYDKAVAEGDKFFNTLIYDKAIDAFTEAMTYLPMEKYPKEMISKIKRAILENAIVDVIKTSVIIEGDKEQQFSFTPVNIASRKNNYIFIKIKNLSNRPFNVLVRYGKDKQTSGGTVIRNLNTGGEFSDRLISVRDQDPWYREDNNWISIFPQGGDIEVSFLQISRVAE